MAQVITDVLSITSADGWRYDPGHARPVVLALVAFFDTDYPNLGVNKRVIALSDLAYSDELIGTTITGDMTPILIPPDSD